MKARVVTAQKRQFCKRPTTAKCVSLTVWGAEAWSKEQLHSCPFSYILSITTAVPDTVTISIPLSAPSTS